MSTGEQDYKTGMIGNFRESVCEYGKLHNQERCEDHRIKTLEAENKRLREVLVRCAIPLEALKIVPDGLGDEVRTAIEDAVKSIRAALKEPGVKA